MDENLYNLNLDYLILAHEMIQSGQEQKAMFSLGLSSEAVSILRELPAKQLKEIAGSEYICFTPRFNVGNWRKFLTENPSNESQEDRARRLLMFLPTHENNS